MIKLWAEALRNITAAYLIQEILFILVIYLTLCILKETPKHQKGTKVPPLGNSHTEARRPTKVTDKMSIKERNLNSY